jgi:hypothetical protein
MFFIYFYSNYGVTSYKINKLCMNNHKGNFLMIRKKTLKEAYLSEIVFGGCSLCMKLNYIRDEIMRKSFCLTLATTSVLAGSAVCQAAQKPNIIYILADDAGIADFGCYGGTKIMTPHVDALCKDGLKFTQHYSGSTVCAPSRSVLMTGQHTGHTTVRGNANVALKAEDITVAEVLKGAGYATGCVGKWGL